MAAAGKSSEAESPSMVDRALNELRLLGYTVFKGKVLQDQTLLEFEWQGYAHYDRLGEAVLQYIYAVMQEYLSLRKVPVPMETRTERGPSPTSNIFVSDDLESNSYGLMLLIQGSGAVRPGYWARALCINNSLMEGTCLPDIQHARARGWAVAVLNPNTSSWTDPKSGIKQFVRGMGGSRHGLSCWDAILSKSPARSIAMIAHSAGGGVAYEMLRKRPEVLKRTQFLALTDAVQCISRRDPPDLQRFYKQQCLDWVTSPPRAQIKKQKGGLKAWVRRHGTSFNGIVNTRPAGHRKHEWATASARHMVWSVTDTFMRRNGALPPTHKPATGVPMWKQPYAETIAAVLEEERAKRAADIAASAAAAPDEAGLEEGKQGGSAAGEDDHGKGGGEGEDDHGKGGGEGEDDHGKGGGEGSAVSIRSSPATGGTEMSGTAQGDSERDDAAEVHVDEARPGATADDDQHSYGAAGSAESYAPSYSTTPAASEEPSSGYGAAVAEESRVAVEEGSGDAVEEAS